MRRWTTVCPSCHSVIQCDEGDHAPRVGDWNICGRCFAVSRFVDDRLTCRLAGPFEVTQDLSRGEIDADAARVLLAVFARRRPERLS